MNKIKETKSLWKMDIGKVGTAITIILSLAAVLISVGGAKYEISDASNEIKDVKLEVQALKENGASEFKAVDKRFDSMGQKINEAEMTDAEVMVLIEKHIIPTLDRIDKNVRRLDDKLDRHMEKE
jgi:hypothetical protein